MRSALRRLLALLLGVLLALAVGEGMVRAREPQALERVSRRLEAGAEESPLHPRHGLYQVDPELGVRPVLGGPLAGPHGCAPNDYAIEKPEGTQRVLFVGDSVTRRGAIVRGLREVWGEDGIEYWNGGVEGYAMHQTDRYHARYLAGLDADHVVLTFHLNDYGTTPVAFLDGDRLVVHATELASARTNRWLFQRSHLYRLWLSWRLSASSGSDEREAVVSETERALVTLKQRVEAGGARFSVLLFPWLSPRDEWPRNAHQAYARARALFEAQGVHAYDLTPMLEEALADGEPVEALRERPRDPEHPSDAFGLRAARVVVAAGLVPD